MLAFCVELGIILLVKLKGTFYALLFVWLLKFTLGLGQCISTFMDLRHPSLVIKQYGGTPSFNFLVHIDQVQNLADYSSAFGAHF